MAYPSADDYKNTLPYPSIPGEPAVLRKKARDLTADEAASLTTTLADHEAAVAAAKAARTAYNAENNRLHLQLKADLEVAEDVVGHPKADKVWKMANDQANGSGHSDIISIYSDLVELIK
jgi:hypothetical protein